MFNIRKSEDYSWDAVNNISREQVEEFIKLLQHQLKLDVVLPFEIADRRTEKRLTWYEAQVYVKTLGDGWRLPTSEELDLIYKSDNDFEEAWYWSSTEFGKLAWNQYFYNGPMSGTKDYHDKTFHGYVRAIRESK